MDSANRQLMALRFMAHYEGGFGLGKGVAVVRIPSNASKKDRKIAYDALHSVAQANSTKNKLRKTDWGKYHRKKSANKQIKLF